MKAMLVAVFLAIATQAADPAALVTQGFAQLEKSDLAGARKTFESAVTLARSQSNSRAEADALRGLGTALYQQGRWNDAPAPLEQSIKIYQSLGDRLNEARALDQLGSSGAMTRRPDVDQLYRRAMAIFEEAGLKSEQARVIRNWSHLPDVPLEQKIPMLEQALALADGDKRLQGLVLHSWGSLLQTRGQYGDAAERFEKAKPLLVEAGTPRELARLTGSMGAVYQMHGQSERAIEIYLESLRLLEQIGDQAALSQTAGLISGSYATLGQARRALEYRERAYQYATKTGSPGLVLNSIAFLAQSYVDLGEYARAVKLAEEAIGDDDRPDVTTGFYRFMARAYEGVGRRDDAIRIATRGIEAARERNRTQIVMGTLAVRAAIYERGGQLDLALIDARDGLATLEKLRTQLAPNDFLKGGFAANFQELFALTIGLLDKTGKTNEAVGIAEQARARAFVDLLATRESDPAMASLTMRGGASKPEFPSTASAPVPTAETVTAESARLGSTMVSFWVGNDATIVWAVAPDGKIVSHRVPIAKAALQKLVTRSASFSGSTTTRGGALDYVRLRGGSKIARDTDAGDPNRELYDLLIAPIRSALPKQEGLVTIVPHGPLFELSFAALSDARGRYLLEDYRLHYAPSAATLEFTALRKRRSADANYLFVANPVTSPKAAPEPLPSLPGAEREVRAVAKLLPARAVTTLTGRNATELAITSSIDRYRVVHFATHGLISNQNPFDSFLAVASNAGDQSDGRLTAAEVYGMHLSADLVVLSACRAAGGRISGDGILGLTRAFFSAGTPSILASMWDMADESAEHLLPKFYADWSQTHDKARALRSAQLSMLRDLRAGRIKVNTPLGAMALPPHPSLWANLILIGEPQ